MAEIPSPRQLLSDLTDVIRWKVHNAIGAAIQWYLTRLNRD